MVVFGGGRERECECVVVSKCVKFFWGASFLWMIGCRGRRARPTSYLCVVQLVCPVVFLSFPPIFFTVVSERFAIDLS